MTGQKQPKYPATAAATELALQRANVPNARQLAIRIGWTDMEGGTRAARLRRGETNAEFTTILPVLLGGGLLIPEAEDLLRPLLEDVWPGLTEALDRARRLAGEGPSQEKGYPLR